MTLDEFKMLKVNDIVVYTNISCRFFTTDKYYKVLGINIKLQVIEVKCDDNVILTCSYSEFTTLEKYQLFQRKCKLKKIFMEQKEFSNLKNGDIIVCIDDKFPFQLTLYKQYTVIDKLDYYGLITILNDLDGLISFEYDLFITLYTYNNILRKQKINKLNDFKRI